jgi:tetratricopeptide (TPR) repeat protein
MRVLRPSLAAELDETWDDFCWRYLTRRSGDAELLHGIIEADPDSGVAHAVAALFAVVGGDDSFDARAEAAAARAGRAPQEWESSFVDVATRTVENGAWSEYDAWQRHAETHPADLISFDMAGFLIATSTRSDMFEGIEQLIGRTRSAVGEHVSVLGYEAMLRQEQGRLDEAHRLASRCLELDPPGSDGAHPMAHVYFESGDHAEGLAFLDRWLPTTDQESLFTTHLVWHAALHELQLGRADQAVERYLVCGGTRGPSDGTSLLWRCQMLGHVTPGTDPATPTMAEVVAPLVDGVPFTFVGAHVALGLATAGDSEGLRRFARAAEGFTVPGASELLPDLSLGFAAYVEGDYAGAAEVLGRCADDFVRLGGSHAQREVFEDTLIQARTRAGQLEDAAALIQARLDRRPSPIDSALLNRTRSPLASAAE